jgi:hypothetical protein
VLWDAGHAREFFLPPLTDTGKFGHGHVEVGSRTPDLVLTATGNNQPSKNMIKGFDLLQI